MSTTELSVPQLIGLRLVVAVAAASLGALVAVSFKKISHITLCVLISFAAGALLSVAVLDIFPEAVEIAGPLGGVASILSGYFLFWMLSRFVSHVCPACSATHAEANFNIVTLTMVLALAVHSFMDGLAIYSGYVAAPNTGFLILLAVAFHKFPEGMALTLVARGTGIGRVRAWLITFGLEAATTLAGGFIGTVALVSDQSRWTGLVLGHVGGGFVYIVLHALLSEFFKHHPRTTLIASVCGGGSIALAGFLLGGH